MTESELRLGNYLEYNGRLCTVVAIDWIRKTGTIDKRQYKIGVEMVDGGKVMYADISLFDAVVIAKDWFKFFKFDQALNGWWDETEGFSIHNGFFCIATDEIIKCKHIHQLQNLYYSLTQNELSSNIHSMGRA